MKYNDTYIFRSLVSRVQLLSVKVSALWSSSTASSIQKDLAKGSRWSVSTFPFSHAANGMIEISASH